MNNEIDITLIQESWIRKCDGRVLTEVREYSGHDIVTYRKPVKLEVAVISRKKLTVNKLKCNLTFKLFEHIPCKVITNKGPVLIANIYCCGYSSMNKFTLRHFISELTQFLDDVGFTGYSISICT